MRLRGELESFGRSAIGARSLPMSDYSFLSSDLLGTFSAGCLSRRQTTLLAREILLVGSIKSVALRADKVPI